MAEIDSLEIKIASDATKANNVIDSLVKNLDRLSTSLKIDTSGLEKIGKSLNFSGISNFAKNIQSQTQKVSKSLSQIMEQYKDLGKGFEIKGSAQQIQKQIDSLINQLAKAKLAKEDFETSGRTNLGGYETAVKNVIKYTNQIESLKKQLIEMKNVQPKLDLDTSGLEKRKKYIIEYKKELLDLKEHVKSVSDIYGGYSNSPKGTFDAPIKQLQTSIQELKRDYPQATEVISAFEKELQRLQDISSKLTKEPTRVKVDTTSLDKINGRITELTKRFENLGKNFKFKGNFEQLNIEIEKTTSKLHELGLKEQEMLSLGKVNTNDFEKLQADIMETGNKLDIMKDLSAKTEEFYQSLQKLHVPPIHEENLVKLQNALRKTEENTEKLKARLHNLAVTGKITPNIDDSTFKNLTIKIAESEKQAEALRQKIQEVGKSEAQASLRTNALRGNLKHVSSTMKNFQNSTKRAVTGLKSFARQALASMGIYLGIFGIVRGLKSAIKSAMNYVETLNYFNAAFGQVASKADLSSFEELGYESAEAYYKSFSERAKELTSKMTGFEISDTGKLSATGAASLGIDPSQLMNYQAMFAQMSSSMGVASETSLKLSQALTEIGADLASVRNMDFDKVWQDMASGLAGMSRTLDKYGVNIRNVNLQQKLNELGINANISALNQENKVMLRSIILLESTEYAYADLAKTINAPANQLRLLKSNFNNLARTMGNIFLPIVSKILPYINGLTIALQRLFTFIGELIGLDMDLSNLGGIGSNEAADDILGDLQDNLDNASESAKELKNELLGFDEVTKLSDTLDTENAGAGISGIDSALLDKAFDEALNKYQETWDKAFADMENGSNIIADKIENTFKKIAKAVSPTTEALKNLWDNGLKKFNDFQYDVLTGFYENFLKPVGEWAIGTGLPDLINCLNEIYNSINWKKILDNFNKFWKVMQPFAIGFGKGIIDFFKALMQIGAFTLEAIGNAIGFIADALGIFSPNTLEALGYAMATLAAGFLAFKAGVAIANGILKISRAISTLLAAISAHPIIAAATAVGALVTAIVGFVSAKNEANEEPLEIKISENVQEFADKIDKATTSLKTFKEQSQTTLDNIEIGYENALVTAQKYFELSQKDPSLFTEADLANLKSYKDTLEQYGIDMKGSIDEVTGAWRGTNEELIKLIENQRNASKLQAYTDIMAEAQKQDITLRRDLQEAFDQFEDKDLLADLWTRFNKGQTKLSDKEIRNLAKQYGKTTDEIGSAMEAFNSLSEVYFAVAENQKYLNGISEEYIQFQKDMGYVSSDVSSDMLKDTRDVLDGITTGIHVTTDNLTVLADGTEENTVKVIDAMSEAGKAVENFGERTGQVSQKVAGICFPVNVTTEEAHSKIDELEKVYEKIPKEETTNVNVETSKAIQMVNAAANTIDYTLTHLTTPELELKTQKAVVAATNFAEMVKSSLEKISITPTVNKANLGFNIGLGIRKFAAGGFPTSGLSLVGENGPELYGSFNGRPAVAANASITEGIKQAAYEGMKMALAEYQGGGTPVVVTLQGDTKKFFTAMQSEAQNYVAANNLSPFPV